MKKMMVYANGKTYFDLGNIGIFPSIPPTEEYDISNLTQDEIDILKINPNNSLLKKKIKKING